MLRIGLTGGIASGKTTVARLFAECGATIIDTDVISRDLVKPGSAALEEIRRRFGAQVLADDGTLDRAALRKTVFGDDDSRAALEGILHPRIRDETLRLAEISGGPYQVIVVPLLVESTLKSLMDRIVVVDCNPETQLGRLLNRDSENVQQAKRMIAAQATREDRLAIADYVVANDGNIADTRRQVEDLHRNFLQIAATGRSAE